MKNFNWSNGCAAIAFISLFMVNCTTPVHHPAELTRVSFESKLDQQEHDFFLYLPKDYGVDKDKKWPVLMFLHGDGERGNGRDELDWVMVHGPLYEAWVQKRDLPFILVVPQLPMFGRDTLGFSYLANRDKSRIPKRLDDGVPPREPYFDTPQPMTGAIAADSIPGDVGLADGWNRIEDDLLTMLDLVQANYQADENRVYLSGLSYGGFGTWYMAGKHPERFAAINPIVGWGDPDQMGPIAEYKIPVWAFSGGRDRVVETKYFYAGINKLEELGLKVRYTIHEDLGHDTWKRVYAGEDIYEWFLSRSKK
jgi:predicted peptidase